MQKLRNIKSISCGNSHVIALSAEKNQVYTWGRLNFEGEVKTVPSGPLWAELGFDKIASGTYHNIAVTKYGEVYEWKVGEPPARIGGTLGSACVRDVAAGAFHSLALTFSGDVYAWGRNKHGQLGIPDDLETQVRFSTFSQRLPY